MKKLLILPLLVLLTGCVTYYHPETALEDGVYYAEDDPSYVVNSGFYTGVAYYPWYSLDYFYLGYYPSYSFAYGYPSGFSIGFNYGFSPWYHPSHYYGYYSPWYGSQYHHHYYPMWRSYRGYHTRQYDGRYQGKRHHRDDRYAGNDRHDNDRNDQGNHSDDRGHRDDYPRDQRGLDPSDLNRSSSVRRYVSTAPGGQNSNRGMVIRNGGPAKVGKNRLHVDQSTTAETTKAKSTETRAVAQPNYSTKRAGTEVRYRSDAKQTPSRTGPVSPAASSKGLVVKAAPANGASQSSRANTSRQAPVRTVSSKGSNQQSRSKASTSRSRSQPSRVTQAPSKRSSGKQKSSRPSNRR